MSNPAHDIPNEVEVLIWHLINFPRYIPMEFPIFCELLTHVLKTIQNNSGGVNLTCNQFPGFIPLVFPIFCELFTYSLKVTQGGIGSIDL